MNFKPLITHESKENSIQIQSNQFQIQFCKVQITFIWNLMWPIFASKCLLGSKRQIRSLKGILYMSWWSNNSENYIVKLNVWYIHKLKCITVPLYLYRISLQMQARDERYFHYTWWNFLSNYQYMVDGKWNDLWKKYMYCFVLVFYIIE